MRNWTLIGLGMAMGLMAPAGAAALEAPDTPDSPISSREDSAPRYVPLREVLPELSEQTGIQFQVPESLQDEMIPWREEGGDPSTDWVQNHSRVELWNEETGPSRIILMNGDPWSAPSPQKTARVEPLQPDKPVSRPNKVSNKPLPKLSKEKALKLGGLPREYLAQLWEDVEYRDFFTSAGVPYPEVLSMEGMVERVRKKARILLYRMQTEPWAPSPLTREKAVMVGGVYGGSLRDLWQDEEYRGFFTAIGVNAPNDLKKTDTIIKVRQEARKLFKLLQDS